MSDKLINSAWRFVLISLLFVLGAGAMFQLYQGMLDLIGGRWEVAIEPGIGGILMAAAVYWLARHREDLVDYEIVHALLAQARMGSRLAAQREALLANELKILDQAFTLPASLRWSRPARAGDAKSADAPEPNRLAA